MSLSLNNSRLSGDAVVQKKMETVLNRNVLHVHSSAMVLRAQRGLGAGLVGLAVAAASVGALAPPVPLFRALGPSATSPKRFTSLVFGSTLGLKCDRRPVSAVHGHADEEMGREGEGSCDDAEARRVANVQALEHHYAGRDREMQGRDGFTKSSICLTGGRTVLAREHLSSLKRAQLQVTIADTVLCICCYLNPLHILTSSRWVVTFDRLSHRRLQSNTASRLISSPWSSSRRYFSLDTPEMQRTLRGKTLSRLLRRCKGILNA